LLVLNKWDLGEDVDLDHERARVAAKLRLRPRVLTASALTGRNLQRVLAEALALADRRAGRVPTPELNRFLADLVATRQPPARQRHWRRDEPAAATTPRSVDREPAPAGARRGSRGRPGGGGRRRRAARVRRRVDAARDRRRPGRPG